MAITPYMTKSGKRYRTEVYKDGVRIAAKAGFTNQQDAKKWEARALTPVSYTHLDVYKRQVACGRADVEFSGV